jgi:hypothetical protein
VAPAGERALQMDDELTSQWLCVGDSVDRTEGPVADGSRYVNAMLNRTAQYRPRRPGPKSPMRTLLRR